MSEDPYDTSQIKHTDVSSFSSIMNELRIRPEWFLGTGNQNFGALQAFLNGYSIANPHNIEFHRFLKWLADSAVKSANPLEQIRMDHVDEAYEKFWTFYDEYLESTG